MCLCVSVFIVAGGEYGSLHMTLVLPTPSSQLFWVNSCERFGETVGISLDEISGEPGGQQQAAPRQAGKVTSTGKSSATRELLIWGATVGNLSGLTRFPKS